MDNNGSVVVEGTEVATGADIAVVAAATLAVAADMGPSPTQELVVVDPPINLPVAELPAVVAETVLEAPVVEQRAAKAAKTGSKKSKKTVPVEPEAKKPAAKKTEKTVVVEEKKPQRGRPIKYFGARKNHFVTLMKKYGISGTMKILNANVNSKDAEQVELANKRSLKLVPEGLGITAPTLGKYAAEAGIVLHRGRPPIKKAAKLKKAA